MVEIRLHAKALREACDAKTKKAGSVKFVGKLLKTAVAGWYAMRMRDADDDVRELTQAIEAFTSKHAVDMTDLVKSILEYDSLQWYLSRVNFFQES